MFGNDSENPRKLFSPEDRARIGEAVRRAEQGTSGEIRVHIERRCPGGDPLARARALLTDLGMQETRARTGVLIYAALADRRCAIFGDEAIDRVIGSAGWNAIIEALSKAFGAGAPTDGLCAAVEAVGAVLSRDFPIHDDDVNELPNEPSLGE